MLTDFRVALLRDGKSTPLPLAAADADYSQANFDVSLAIDDDPASGWAVDGGTKREPRTAVFRFATPWIPEDGDRITVELRHESPFDQHAIGRFRISYSTAPDAPLDTAPTPPPIVAMALRRASLTPSQQAELDTYFAETRPEFATQREALQRVEAEVQKAEAKRMVNVMVMREMEQPRQTYVLQRGEYDQPDISRPAEPNLPALFGGFSDDARRDRLGFARWLVSPDHPLTARVTVNRFWQAYFGKGLVRTPEDFGSQGSPPTHPMLLDWLASEFRDSGWDVKALQKLIVMSQTYRQSSRVKPEEWERDPENLWLARAPRTRLSGYQLRDQALFASGLLVRKLGGPSVKPYQPPGLWAEVSFQDKSRSTDFYVQDHGDKLHRRSLYTFWKRSVAPPMLANFDAAGREMCTVRQTRTSTPLQALNLMNDVTFIEAARALAQRLLSEESPSAEDRIRAGLALVGADERAATIDRLAQSLADYQEYFADHEDDCRKFLSHGEWPHDPALNPADLAAYTAIASVILNLDEVIVRQ